MTIAEDAGAQPEIAPASNQKAFKQKDRTDKQLNTFESDPFFLAFSAKLNKTAEKLPSAEVQLDTKKDTSAQTREELIRNNPLLKYMREKAEKKIQERRLLKRGGSSSKSLQVTSVLAKSGSKSVSSSKSGKERSSRSGREKSGREAREAREGGRKGRESKSAPSSGGGGGAGEGAVPIREGGRDPRPPRDGAPREIKEKGGRDRGKGKGRGKDNSGTASGGGQEGGESGGAPMVPKFTIAKRADSSQGQQGAGAGVSGVGGGRGGSGGAPRGDDHADRGHGAGAGGGVGEGNKPLRRENNPSTAEGSGGGAGRGGGRGRGGGGRDGGGGRGPREGRGGGPAQQGHSQGQGQSAPSRV